MTDYRAAAADYLATRRAMGYKLAYQGQMLAQFVVYLEAVGAEHLTIRQAMDWAKQPSSAARAWWAVRLSTVRGFARYLSALDPATEIPPAGLIPAPSHRVVPYIYTEDDIAKLLAAAGRLPTGHRADTYQTLIGLVAVTGMREGEAVRLDRDDVDLEQGLLTIRDSKFGKCRQIRCTQAPSRRSPATPNAATRVDTAAMDEGITTRPATRASSSPQPGLGCCATTSARCSRAWSATPGLPVRATVALLGCTTCVIASR
ncbi:MAG: tyrosine-type recombinase/integrase [Mycobacterium leprae]